MKVCIVGASGYTGRELIRLLLYHPNVELEVITSRALDGKPLNDELPYLRGMASCLKFTNPSPEQLASDRSIELFFLALPHGTAASYAKALVGAGKKVIDLSADFRIRSKEVYHQFYGNAHPAPELLAISQYSLPELYEVSWQKSNLLASPGCYPTSILIPLSPLFAGKLIDPKGIVVNSMSGISGAGRNPSETLLFCERNENACAYGLPKHRHLAEIEEQLSFFLGDNVLLSFHPHLVPINRGICTTISAVANNGVSRQDIFDCWIAHYGNSRFVRILEEGNFPEIKNVSGTNGIDLSVHHDQRTGRMVFCSALDNLLKGAGGQAVQAMNLCEGFEEGTGLT